MIKNNNTIYNLKIIIKERLLNKKKIKNISIIKIL